MQRKNRPCLGRLALLALAAGLAGACGGGGESGDAEGAAGTEAERASDPDVHPDDPEILKRPFTAEQIRVEMVPGLVIDLRHDEPEGERHERWTVVTASEKQVTLEYVGTDADGGVTGEPAYGEATWIELRDHATFPVAYAQREKTTRETPLGALDGWLYTLRDEELGQISEYFFADEYPGAPVVYTIHELTDEGRGELIRAVTQLRRGTAVVDDADEG